MAAVWVDTSHHAIERGPDLAHGAQAVASMNNGFLQGRGSLADFIKPKIPPVPARRTLLVCAISSRRSAESEAVTRA